MINEKNPVKHDPAAIKAVASKLDENMFKRSAGLVVEPGKKRIALSEAGLTQKQVEDFFKSFQSFKKNGGNIDNLFECVQDASPELQGRFLKTLLEQNMVTPEGFDKLSEFIKK